MRKRLLIPILISCLGMIACSSDALVDIKPSNAIEYVQLSASDVSLDIGESQQLTAVSSDGKDVRWANSDTTVVRLVVNGNSASITGLSKGTATITAFRKGQSSYCTVLVGGGNDSEKVTLTLSDVNKTINVNDDFTLFASVGGPASAVTFTSNDPSVATVEIKTNKSVKVTGVSEGTATITAKVSNVTAKCEVTVNDPQATVAVSLDKSTLSMTVGNVDKLTATYRPSDAEVHWASSDHEKHGFVTVSF